MTPCCKQCYSGAYSADPHSTTPRRTVLDEPTPKRNDIWRCPLCDNEIILHVRVNEPPVCRNKNAHSSKSQIMVKFNPDRKQA